MQTKNGVEVWLICVTNTRVGLLMICFQWSSVGKGLYFIEVPFLHVHDLPNAMAFIYVEKGFECWHYQPR